MRNTLNQEQIAGPAMNAMEAFHTSCVKEVEEAVKSNAYVVVGMKQNPVVSGARKLLEERNITYKYIEHGSYFSKWKQRLAIKLWSGWPTFPMVFVNGKLIGGGRELKNYLTEQK